MTITGSNVRLTLQHNTNNNNRNCNKLCGWLFQTIQSVWSVGSPLSVTWLWEMNGPRTCRRLAGQSCVMPTASCVTSTTMGMDALSSVGPEMMPSDTLLVASVERSYATLAGRDNTALNVCIFFFFLLVCFVYWSNTVIQAIWSTWKKGIIGG